jgi:ABC-2 type transport system ATP-binding protein
MDDSRSLIEMAVSIETTNITRRFNSFLAVDRLSFRVAEGEVFGILGPNGAGKTTTIRILACLISPSTGSATVAGHDIVSNAQKIREAVGILTENPSLYERLTAYENMNFFAEAYNLSNAQERKSRIKALLDFFNLWERKDDKVSKFSKGMKQKLAIARALVHDPPVLFLDEPTAGLDPEAAKGIRELVENLSKHEKHTIVLSTHHLEDAERLCSRVMIINRGRSVFVGTPDELRNSASHSPVLRITFAELNQNIVDTVSNLPGVKEVKIEGSRNGLLVTLNDADRLTPEVVRTAVQAGGMILSVNVLRPTLEEAYLKLVKVN